MDYLQYRIDNFEKKNTMYDGLYWKPMIRTTVLNKCSCQSCQSALTDVMSFDS